MNRIKFCDGEVMNSKPTFGHNLEYLIDPIWRAVVYLHSTTGDVPAVVNSEHHCPEHWSEVWVKRTVYENAESVVFGGHLNSVTQTRSLPLRRFRLRCGLYCFTYSNPLYGTGPTPGFDRPRYLFFHCHRIPQELKPFPSSIVPDQSPLVHK